MCCEKIKFFPSENMARSALPLLVLYFGALLHMNQGKQAFVKKEIRRRTKKAIFSVKFIERVDEKSHMVYHYFFETCNFNSICLHLT